MRNAYLALGSSVAIVCTLALNVGCGDSSSTGGAGGTGTATVGSTTTASSTEAATTGSNTTGTTTATTGATVTATSTGTGTLTCSGATPVALTVKNYLGWCTVTAGTNTPTPAAEQTICVADGNVNVSATANATFELGLKPWHDVVGDTGNGVQGTVTGNPPSSAAVVAAAGATKCAWVCCETAGMTDCPTADQCP